MRTFNLTQIAEFEVLENPMLELIKGGALTPVTCTENACGVHSGSCLINTCTIHHNNCGNNDCGVNCLNYVKGCGTHCNLYVKPSTGTNPGICTNHAT